MRTTVLSTILSTLSTIFLYTVSAVTIYAQETGTISGYIYDAQTTEPLSGANAYIQNTQIGAATDRSGRYLITNIAAGTYTLVSSYIGYTTVTKTVDVRAGGMTVIDFSLDQDALRIPEVIIERQMLLGGTGKITGIPGSAHYIDYKELAKFSYNDIHRILRTIPGVNIQEEDGYGLRPNIGMRGTGVERSQKINIMEDGVLIAPAPYSAPAAYYFPTVGRMAAIEVRKGSSQIKYGPYTTGGSLNLISTKIPFEFDGRMNLTAGENGMRGIHATAGDSYKNFGFLVETYQANTDGFKELDGGGNTGFDKKDYMVKMRLNSNHDAKYYQLLSIKIGQTNEVSYETYLGLTEADFLANPYRRYASSQVDVIDTEHTQIAADYFVQFGNAIDLTTTLYRNEFKRNWYKLDKVQSASSGSPISIARILENPAGNEEEYAVITGKSSTSNNALEVKANNRSYLSTGIQSIFGLEFGTQETTLHQIEFGLRYHEDEIDRFQWVDVYKMERRVMKLTDAGIPGTESNRIGKAEAWAFFAQYKFNKGKLTTIPGIRYETMTLRRDDYGKSDPERTGSNLQSRNNDVSIWIPGIGIEYALTSHFSTFAGIHKGFSPPGSKAGTKPEISINYELGSRYSHNALNTGLVLFFNDYDNLLGVDLAGAGGSGSGDLFNGGEVDTKGLEYTLGYDLGNAFHTIRYSFPVNITYTFTDSKFKNSFKSEYEPWGTIRYGDALPYLPRHQFSLQIGLLQPSWTIYFSSKYVSKMRTEAGQGDFVKEKSTDAHLIIDTSADYSITKKNKLFVAIQNITDKPYIAARRPAGIRPGLPRTLIMGIKTDF